MTKYEIRDTSEEGGEPDKNREKLTARMAAWVEKLEAGYTIRKGTITHARSFPRWSWQLFNPEGAYVQTVRGDMVRRLREAGYLPGVTMEGINVIEEKTDDGILR